MARKEEQGWKKNKREKERVTLSQGAAHNLSESKTQEGRGGK